MGRWASESSRPHSRARSSSPAVPDRQRLLLRHRRHRHRRFAAINGIAVDAISDRPLSGATVKVDGVGDTVTTTTGSFHLDAGDPQIVRGVTVSSSQTVERATRLRRTGPRRHVDAAAHLARSRRVRSDAPQRRRSASMDFGTTARRAEPCSSSHEHYRYRLHRGRDGHAGRRRDVHLGGFDVDAAAADRECVHSEFGDQQRETAAEGDRVRVSRSARSRIRPCEGLQSRHRASLGDEPGRYDRAERVRPGRSEVCSSFPEIFRRWRVQVRFRRRLRQAAISPVPTKAIDAGSGTTPTSPTRSFVPLSGSVSGKTCIV